VSHKINPYGFRLGANPAYGWRSKWYADKHYQEWLQDDLKIRAYVTKTLAHAGISKVDIERKGDRLSVDVHTARPGIVIGRKGSEVDRIREDIKKLSGKDNVQLNVLEIREPELDAALVAQGIAEQLQGRVAFRRAMRRGIQNTLRAGAKGVRVQISGRLGGGEMSRSESYREGRVPLHTIRAEIDYGLREAATQTGRIGVKVWIYKGDVQVTREAKEAELIKARARVVVVVPAVAPVVAVVPVAAVAVVLVAPVVAVAQAAVAVPVALRVAVALVAVAVVPVLPVGLHARPVAVPLVVRARLLLLRRNPHPRRRRPKP
jgi:small subunit ribosomal protein S3